MSIAIVRLFAFRESVIRDIEKCFIQKIYRKKYFYLTINTFKDLKKNCFNYFFNFINVVIS